MNKKEAIIKIRLKIKKTVSRSNFDKQGSPSFIPGNDIGILLIHGIDNTAFIMNEYMNALTKEGYTIYNITLPGRGMTVKELGASPWQEWVSFVKEDYLLLKQTVKKVFIAGFSTGATIALYLCEILDKKDQPDGLLLLSPALFFVNRLIPHGLLILVTKICSKLIPYPKKLNNSHKIFIDPEARKKYYFLYTGSSNTMLQLLLLSKFTKKNIKKVKNPMLVIQSTKDIVICSSGAKWLMKNCNSSKKEYFELHRSGHPVMVDIEKNKVYKKSIKYISSLHTCCFFH